MDKSGQIVCQIMHMDLRSDEPSKINGAILDFDIADRASQLHTHYSTRLMLNEESVTVSLADGQQNQVKIVRLASTMGGKAVLRPANLKKYTCINFTNDGDFVKLIFSQSHWHIVDFAGATVITEVK